MKTTKAQKLETLKPFYNLTQIYSTYDIERKHKGFWFSKDTIRFFKSKVVDEVFPTNNGKVYFVSSEKNQLHDKRAFTVRCYNIKDDFISTIGEFQAYETKTQALTAALNCAYDDSIPFLDNSDE
jgi:hypothetical protein